MENTDTFKKQFLEYVKKLVYKIFENERVLQGEWHLGKVQSIVDTKRLKVFIDGSDTPQTVAANPDVTFNVGDEIWVVYPNKSSASKFAICRRAV